MQIWRTPGQEDETMCMDTGVATSETPLWYIQGLPYNFTSIQSTQSK